MQLLQTFDELDQKFEEISRADSQGADVRQQMLGSFRMDVQQDLPSDPFSDAYRQHQLEIYRKIAGKAYVKENEVSAIDVEAAITRPFPFYTGSTAIAGMHMAGLGFVISNLRLRPGARILEFGPGWGNTTITLAALGFDVTAVDIEQRYCDLINRRAALNKLSVKTVLGDFFYVEETDERFDAVLFYECFHHCSDHIRLLRGLHRVVKPLGRVYIAAEPIIPDFPVPWGVRSDGESLWAIRQLGWLELGFQDSYFRDVLAHTGWSYAYRASKDISWATIWELEEYSEQSYRAAVADGRIGTVIGTIGNERISIQGGGPGFVVYGPYATLAAGRWCAYLELDTTRGSHGFATIDVGSFAKNLVFGQDKVDLGRYTATGVPTERITMMFDLASPVSEVEVRLHADTACHVSVVAIGFDRIS